MLPLHKMVWIHNFVKEKTMDDQSLTLLNHRLDKLEFMLSLQNKLIDELLDLARSTQLSSAFSVDAINGVYGVLGKMTLQACSQAEKAKSSG